jgi:hypothetical protein
VRALTLTYYALLRSIVRTHPEMRRCLTRCRHCRIFFFTDPRNAGRRDLGCPFGCAEAHCKCQSNRRSTAYYQDEYGKEKKRQLNARRRKPAKPAPVVPPQPLPEESLLLMVEYVRMVTSLLEGRPVSLGEVLGMLLQVVRQQGMVHTGRIGENVVQLYEHPP